MAKTQIYMKDLKVFNKLCKSIQLLWYTQYGTSLTKGGIVLKALALLEAELLGNKESNDPKGQDIHKYKRTGL